MANYTATDAQQIQGMLLLLRAFFHVNAMDSDAGSLLLKVRSEIADDLSMDRMMLAFDIGTNIGDDVYARKVTAQTIADLQRTIAQRDKVIARLERVIELMEREQENEDVHNYVSIRYNVDADDIVTDATLVNHGREHEQYFQGCGIAFTTFSNVVTGMGDDESEAFEDALEMLAQAGHDMPHGIEMELKHEVA